MNQHKSHFLVNSKIYKIKHRNRITFGKVKGIKNNYLDTIYTIKLVDNMKILLMYTLNSKVSKILDLFIFPRSSYK